VEIVALRNAASIILTEKYGVGHWSGFATEKSVLRSIATSLVLVGRIRTSIVATLRLQTKKPWAIDASYFTPCKRPLYLLDMAVLPEKQRRGHGRALLDAAMDRTRAWPAQAIRLDAYDADAGAGEFYRRCGYTETGRVVYRTVPLIYYELVLDAR